MPMLATVLWWIVLGMLLGWMGSWMFNRTLRTRGAGGRDPAAGATERVVEVPVERVVERVVEVPVERVVERVVEVPVERVVERVVETPVERIVERRIEVPVERVVERVVEVPVQRVAADADAQALEARDATIRALRGRVVHLEALAGVLSGRVAAVGAAAPVEAASAPAVPGDGPSAVPSAAPARTGPDFAAAAAAGFAPRHADDLEIVEGIGPRIAALLRDEGIATWRALAACPPARLRDVLDLGGPGFRIADPGSWPEQAGLAAEDRWAELRALQDRLVAGRR